MTKSLITENKPAYGQEISHIQPYGFMLLVDRANFSVLKCSANICDSDDEELHETVGSLLGTEAELILKQLNSELKSGERHFILLPVIRKGRCNTWVSVIEDTMMVEVETEVPDLELSALNIDELKFLISKVKEAHQYVDIYKRSCSMVRYLTGFERVYMLRFNKDGTSTVVGESRRKHLDTMLGLKFRATHAVNTHKNFLMENRLRMVPNIDYQDVAIIPGVQDDWLYTEKFAVSNLRGLKNSNRKLVNLLGIKSFISLPIGTANEINGQILAVHESPMLLSAEIRLLLEDFSRNISSHLKSKQREKELSHDISLKIRVQFLMEKIKAHFPGQNLEDDVLPDMLDLFNNTGVAAVIDGAIYPAGETPVAEDIRTIAKIVRGKMTDGVFASECLSHVDARAKRFTDTASGVIAVALEESAADLLIFFLPGRSMVSYWISESIEHPDDQEFVEFLPDYRMYLDRSTHTDCSEPIADVEIVNARLLCNSRHLFQYML